MSSTTSATATTTGRGSAAATPSLALTVHSLRGVFGLGRTARAKIMPFAAGRHHAAARRRVHRGRWRWSSSRALALHRYAVHHAGRPRDLPGRAGALPSSRPTCASGSCRSTCPGPVTHRRLRRRQARGDDAGAVPAARRAAHRDLHRRAADRPARPPPTGGYLGALAMRRDARGAAGLASALAIASFTPRRGLGVASVIAFYLLTSAVSRCCLRRCWSDGPRLRRRGGPG